MKEQVGIGILGAGRMGVIHGEQIQATAGLRLAALSSQSERLVEDARRRFDVPVYDDHRSLLEDPRVQWVVIATTSDRHTEWALKALSAGKELIIEKPIALYLKEARKVFDTAKRAGLRVTVHQNRRWDLDYQLVQKVVREGMLGDVYRIESRYTNYSKAWGAAGAEGLANPWRLKKSYGGGVLNDWGSHLLDQLILLAEEPVTTVLGRCESRIWSEEVDDHFWAELSFGGGFSARVEASVNFRIPVPRWTIVGNRGTLQVTGGNPEQWNTAVVRREAGPFAEEIRYDIPHPMFSTGFYAGLVQALEENRPLPVRPDQTLMVMRLIEAVRESSRLGRTVVVEPEGRA